MQNYSSGDWTVKEGSEQDFMSRWQEFLQWSRDNAQGLQHAYLLQDTVNPRHFVSLGLWDSPDFQERWRSMPGFREKLKACQDLCDTFSNSRYQQVVTVQ
jgi:heme-degrading monooxygenase HmoA